MGFDVSRRSGAAGETLLSGQNKLQVFLPEIVRYLSSVPRLCCTNEAINTSLAYRVVGGDGRVLYDASFEGFNQDVLQKVMTLSLPRPTYFNSALLRSFEDKFRSESRAGVKVLLIFSDGLDEDVMILSKESERLRKSGLSALLVVALDGVGDVTRLQAVEFGRGFGYNVPLSIGTPSIGSVILKQIDAVSDRECCNVTCKCSGHEGIRGSRGPPGPKGVSGQKGYPGFPGEEGAPGERGPPGPFGPPGVQGCPGLGGQKGNRGLRGNRGEDGEDGVDGIDGEQGAAGGGGARGEPGAPGNPGIPGISGEPGLKGQRGLRGDPGEPGNQNLRPGPRGEPGNPGLPGPPGPDGEPGERGVVGNPGPDGRRGPPGEKGLNGPPGSPGPQGSPGASGPQGPKGVRGEPGPIGVPGLPGAQGSPGPLGEAGQVGRRGANGPKGQPGDPGDPGVTGPQGPRGVPGQDGRDGSGPPGPKGAKGDSGFPGYPGLTGEDGTQGPKGRPGHKGNRGRGGNSGPTGESGVSGDPGFPGHRGLQGPPGARSMTDCQLITLIRDNCACSSGHPECPANPTELVFGLDMSDDVTPGVFDRQRSALLSLLEGVNIAESNCPTGTRVSVVGFSTYTKYLIRFQDYRRRSQLVEAVQNIALERTSSKRHLGAAMRFVGQNVFKRVRRGTLMRKVAVFFSNGPSEDKDDILTAVMEYRALNIIPAVISLTESADVRRAMEVDDSGNSIYTVLTRQQSLTDLRRVKNCAICYDPCRRSEECSFIQDPVPPQQVDTDLVMVLDSSGEMQADHFVGAQQLLGSVVEQLVVSSQPGRADNRARVAVVQQGKLEFNLQTYQNQNRMKEHLRNMQQRGGSSALGQNLDFALREVLLKAVQPRKKRAVLTVVSSQTAYRDRDLLLYISQKAKCEGVALFAVTVGKHYNRTQVEELASLPVQQHLVHMSRLKADEQDYVQRFFRVFLSTLNKGLNSYPPASFRQTCSQLTDLEDFFSEPGSSLVPSMFADEPLTEELDLMQEVFVTESTLKKPSSGSSSSSFLKDLNVVPPISFVSKDVCGLSKNIGGCRKYTLQWFYDKQRTRCSRFLYGGCGGNENRFATKKECENTCLMTT